MLIPKPITGKGNGLIGNPSLDLDLDLLDPQSHRKRMGNPHKADDLSMRKKETWLLGMLPTGSATLCSGDVFWPDNASLISTLVKSVITSAPKQWLPYCQVSSYSKSSRIFWCPT